MELVYTRRLTPCLRHASATLRAPRTFTCSRRSSCPGIRLMTEAKWNTSVAPENAASRDAGSRTSPSTISTSRPSSGLRLSPRTAMQRTRCPFSTSCRTRLLPMCPGAPVTTINWITSGRPQSRTRHDLRASRREPQQPSRRGGRIPQPPDGIPLCYCWFRGNVTLLYSWPSSMLTRKNSSVVGD